MCQKMFYYEDASLDASEDVLLGGCVTRCFIGRMRKIYTDIHGGYSSYNRGSQFYNCEYLLKEK